MNNVNLIGRITKDLELKKTQSGISVCSFTIAVDRKFKNKQTGEKETDFINIVTWRDTAEFVGKYLAKGVRIGVSGSLQVRSYEDKNGDRKYVTEVVADDITFADAKVGGQTQSQYSDSYKPKAGTNNFKAEYIQDTLDETALPFDL